MKRRIRRPGPNGDIIADIDGPAMAPYTAPRDRLGGTPVGHMEPVLARGIYNMGNRVAGDASAMTVVTTRK